MHDELQNAIRLGLMVNARNETVTFRHTAADTALPIRKWGAFLPGTGVGGSAVHWNGNIWRFQEADFVLKSHLTERYGAEFADPELMIQDWGVTYDQLEQHYDAFEKLYGACGKTGNLNGEVQDGGNPHEAPRSAEYPNPPMKETYSGALFRKAAESLGHKPFPMPSCTMSQPYTNPLGLKLKACAFLRLLRAFRLRALCQGQPADHDPARGDGERQLRVARELPGSVGRARRCGR
jgi:gluconate 2-dehydrogenase alpha chain